MRYFPIFLDLYGRPCLVVGATEEAQRKAETLRSAGAVVSLLPALPAAPIQPGYVLAVVATGTLEEDRDTARRLAGLGIPLNVVDRPELCSFIWPAIVDRDPVTIAISTAGTSPTLARLIRLKVERAVPLAIGELAALAGRLRDHVRRALPTPTARRAFWRRAFEGRTGRLAFAGKAAAARASLRRYVQSVQNLPQ